MGLISKSRVSLETEAAWLKEHAEKANEEEQVLSDAQGEYDRKHEAFESRPRYNLCRH